MHVGHLVSSSATPIDSRLVASFERHLRALNRSPNTIAHYKITLRMFTAFLVAESMPGLLDASREHCELWLVALQAQYRPHSVRSYYIDLRAFYTWLVDEDEIKKSPLERVKAPAVEESPKDIANPADIGRVLSLLEKKKRWRDAAVVAMFYDTGMRATELADCLRDNVDLDNGMIRLPHTKGKRVREIHLGAKAVLCLDRYLRREKRESEWLILGRTGTKLSRTGVYRIVVRCFAEAGVKAVIGPHDLRHTSASHVADKLPESQMMALYGWTNANMARHYAGKAIAKAAIETHKRISPLDNLPK